VSTSSQAGHTDDAGSVAEYLGGRRMCQARERKPLEQPTSSLSETVLQTPRAFLIAVDPSNGNRSDRRTPGILGRERLQRPAHRFDQRLAGARPGFAHQPLDLRERLLDGVEVRRVGRQVEDLAAAPLDDLPDPLALMGFVSAVAPIRWR
jgi:hypothetical protein